MFRNIYTLYIIMETKVEKKVISSKKEEEILRYNILTAFALFTVFLE